MDIMKEYGQVPAAVELVGDRKASLQTERSDHSEPRLSNSSQDAEEDI